MATTSRSPRAFSASRSRPSACSSSGTMADRDRPATKMTYRKPKRASYASFNGPRVDDRLLLLPVVALLPPGQGRHRPRRSADPGMGREQLQLDRFGRRERRRLGTLEQRVPGIRMGAGWRAARDSSARPRTTARPRAEPRLIQLVELLRSMAAPLSMPSAAAIRGDAERRDEQRHVVGARRIVDLHLQGDLTEEPTSILVELEGQPIDARQQWVDERCSPVRRHR